MRPLWHLAIRNLRAKPMRGILAALVVLLAVSLVTVASLLLACARGTFEKQMTQWLGDVDVRVRPVVAHFGQFVPSSTLNIVRHQPQVSVAGGKVIAFARFNHGSHVALAQLMGLSWPAMNQLRPLRLALGHAISSRGKSADKDIVLDQGLARRLHVRPGQTLTLRGTGKKLWTLRLVGVAGRSAVKRFLQQPYGYISLRLFRQIYPQSSGLTQIDIRLKPGVNRELFVKSLKQLLGPSVKVLPGGHARAAFAGIEGLFNKLEILTVVPTALGAGLLILAVMAIGLMDRIRYLGQLRCIGASRGQLLGTTLCESALPGAAGVVLGVGLAIVGAAAVARHYPHIFGIFAVHAPALAWGVLTGLMASVVGLILPMFQAWRASPMAAVRIAGNVPMRRRVWPLLVAGLLAVGTQIGLWQIPDARVAVAAYALLGSPLLFFAAFAFGPPLAAWLEKSARPVLAGLWRVEPGLLYGAWTRAPYRAGFLIAALLFGVAFFISMRSRGAGLIQSWEFPAHFPDAFVFSPISPLLSTRVASLAAGVPGIKAASGLTAFWVTRQNAVKPGQPAATSNVLFVAVQPESFSRMVGLQFVRGTPQQAMAELKNGTGVLVATRLKHGAGKIPGKIQLRTESGLHSFRVAGVVYSRGMSMAAGYMRVGHIFHSMAGLSILGTLKESKAYFGIGGANMVLLAIKPGFHGMAVVVAVKKYLSRPAHASFFSSIFNFKAMQLHGTSVRRMKRHLDAVVRRVMRALSLLAIVVFLAGGIGAGLIFAADIRARRYQTGILLAVGASRGQVLRLLLAEFSLNVFLAIFLGTLLGIYVTFMATQVDHRLTGFHSLFVVAWSSIPIAALVTVLVALAGAWLPMARASGRPLQVR